MGLNFEQLLAEIEPRLREGLVAAYGLDVGADSCADAVAWAWENRVKLSSISNPAGYLFRVGQSAARSYLRPSGFMPQPEASRIPEIEPGLVPALEQLTESQRVAVVAVHSFGWSQQEVADLLGVSHSTVRTHLARGLDKLRTLLEVSHVN